MFPPASTFKLTDIGLLLAVSLTFLLPVLLIGPPIGSADLLHHMTISNGWLESFEAGDLIPNWIDAENNGYGSVTVRFYPPLIHVTIALFQMLVRSWGLAVFAAFLFWSIIGSLGVFFLTKELSGSRRASLIAASIFVFMPYRTNQFCHAFMAGEFVSLSVLPFAVLFLRRLQARPNLRDSLALGAAVALLILSNIPQLIVAAVCLGVLAIVLTRRSTILLSTGYLIFSGTVALLLTAFFWVRLIAEMSWIKISGPTLDPLYLYSNNFLFDDGSFGGSTDSISLMFATNILLLTYGVALISLIASNAIRKIRIDRNLIALGLALIASAVLSTPLSRVVWDAVPLLQRIQFPWRFLSVVSLCSAVLIGLSFAFVDAEAWSRHRKAILISLGSVLILITFTIRQDVLTATYIEHARFDAIVRNAVPRPGLEDWHPTWTTRDTFTATAPSFLDWASRSITNHQKSSGVREFHIDAGQPSVMRTGVMFYPYWRATIDGSSAVTHEDSGTLAVDIGAEAPVVTLQFVEPTYSVISRKVSTSSLVILLVLAFLIKRQRTGPIESERIWNT